MSENSGLEAEKVVGTPEFFPPQDPSKPFLLTDRKLLSAKMSEGETSGEKVPTLLPPYTESLNEQEARYGALADALTTAYPEVFGITDVPNGTVCVGKPDEYGISVVITPTGVFEVRNTQYASTVSSDSHLPLPEKALLTIAKKYQEVPKYDPNKLPAYQRFLRFDRSGNEVSTDALFGVQDVSGSLQDKVGDYLKHHKVDPSRVHRLDGANFPFLPPEDPHAGKGKYERDYYLKKTNPDVFDAALLGASNARTTIDRLTSPSK